MRSQLTGVCDHCSRITHDSKVCPELLKVGSGQGPAEKMESRGGQRHLHGVKQEQHHNAGGWEKPRKQAKRALDFQSADYGDQGYFPQQLFGGSGPHGPRQYERSQGLAWGQRRNFGEVVTDDGFRRGFQKGSGESSGKGSGFHLNRKGTGPAWPKPLFKVKQASAAKQAFLGLDANLGDSGNHVLQEARDQEGSDTKGDAGASLDMDFEVENDDLLEDGEFGDTDKGDHNGAQDEVVPPVQGADSHPSHGADIQGDQGLDVQDKSGSGPQGDGHKQKQLGKSGTNKVDGKPSDGGRPSKKGMGALPKPPART
ncbi:PREDICTED: uncharacterized protein LOC104724399 isoform X2 [Camelina sativa]|uniref:Uncharacterized protein LOC104724399 isoform X2 n=1 Tax=Camelina sativa TaxID=90675 RepID=A0ABM0UHD5_CAMSA|nr:PREDICTED: uncharacterized protein LOC104724399 isoform X2 [Camelina sativa]